MNYDDVLWSSYFLVVVSRSIVKYIPAIRYILLEILSLLCAHNLLFVLTLSLTIPSANTIAAPAKNKKKVLRKKRKQRKHKGRRSRQKTMGESRPFSAGGGLFSLYLPMPTLQGVYNYRQTSLGVEAGFLLIPLAEFRGETSYYGVDAKYYLSKAFFLGSSYGLRQLKVTTAANFAIDGVDNEVTWVRDVTQNVMGFKLGWHWGRHAVSSSLVGLGVLLPIGSSIATSGEPPSLPGLPADEYELEREVKSEDVKRISFGPAILVEVKYYIHL